MNQMGMTVLMWHCIQSFRLVAVCLHAYVCVCVCNFGSFSLICSRCLCVQTVTPGHTQSLPHYHQTTERDGKNETGISTIPDLSSRTSVNVIRTPHFGFSLNWSFYIVCLSPQNTAYDSLARWQHPSSPIACSSGPGRLSFGPRGALYFSAWSHQWLDLCTHTHTSIHQASVKCFFFLPLYPAFI